MHKLAKKLLNCLLNTRCLLLTGVIRVPTTLSVRANGPQEPPHCIVGNLMGRKKLRRIGKDGIGTANFLQRHPVVLKGRHVGCRTCPTCRPELFDSGEVAYNVVSLFKVGHLVFYQDTVNIAFLVRSDRPPIILHEHNA